MALFQLRKPRKEQAAPPPATQTVEAVRRRALHRLIGAAVLVVAGVIGFPLIFDSQPRPIPVDLPIEIADKDKVAPLQLPPASAPSATLRADAAPATATAPRTVQAPVATEVEGSPVTAATPPAAPAAPAARSDVQAPAVAAAPRSTDASDAQKARALLEGRAAAASASPPASSAAADARFVVQVGAFAEDQKMREVRMKVERAGFKTYTQVVTTKDGPRTRVRVGPFDDRTKAQQAADKIRQLDLAPSILTL